MRQVTLFSLAHVKDPIVRAALQAIQDASADNIINDVGSSGAALSTLTGAAADEVPYFTGPTTVDVSPFPAYGRSLAGAAGVAAAQAILAPPGAAADKVQYFTGATTVDVTALTAYARTLIAAATAGAARAILGVSSSTSLGVFYVDDPAYGAVGDGVTDDTDAINAAIQAAIANGGGIVFFGPKNYAIAGGAANLVVDGDNVWVHGSGKGLTTLTLLNTTSTDVLSITSSLVNCGVSDMTIDMGSFTGHNAIYAQQIDKFFIRRVSVINAGTTGIGCQGLTNFDISDNDITKVTATGASQNNGIILYQSMENSGGTICRNRCIRMNMEPDGNNLLISQNHVTDWKYGGGIVMGPHANTHDNILSGNHCTGGTGIDVDGTHVGGLEIYSPRTTITGNITSGNSGAGILLGGDSMTCTGNLSYANGVTGDPYGIYLQDGGASYRADNCIVTGNRCYGQDYGIGANANCLTYLVANNVLYGNNIGDIDSNVAAMSSGTQFGTTYTVKVSDRYLSFTNSGTVTLTLPAASTCPLRTLRLRQTGGGAVVSASSNVTPRAGGAAGTAIIPAAAAGQWSWLQSDGSTWVILASS